MLIRMGEDFWNRDGDADPLLDFAPVPRKNTVIRGWTVKKQRGFIAALRESGSVRLIDAMSGLLLGADTQSVSEEAEEFWESVGRTPIFKTFSLASVLLKRGGAIS